MIIIVLETAEESLRGQLTRWLLEIKPGVFIGDVSAKVRDSLWDEIVKEKQWKMNGAILAYNTNNEQGFKLKMIGDPHRTVVDMEGVQLIKILKNQ